MGKRFSELETPNGHLVGEAASALQKSIRRGKEEDALYWASWIIASQDVGPADTMVAVQVRCLNENLLEQRKAEKDVPPTSSTSDGSKFAAQFWPRQTPQQHSNERGAECNGDTRARQAGNLAGLDAQR